MVVALFGSGISGDVPRAWWGDAGQPAVLGCSVPVSHSISTTLPGRGVRGWDRG